MRVVRFYVSLFPPSTLLPPSSSYSSLRCQTSTASGDVPSRGRWSLPHLKPRPSAASVAGRTSTAHLRPVFPAGPQPRLSDSSGPCQTSASSRDRTPQRMSEDVSERMSEERPERLSEDMSERMSEDVLQSVCEFGRISGDKMYV